MTEIRAAAASPAGARWPPHRVHFHRATDDLTAATRARAKALRPARPSARLTDARYRANGVAGSGFVDADRPTHIWTVAIGDPAARPAAPRRITSGEFGAANHQWSPDGRELYFTADRRRESYYYPGDSDLYAVALEGGEPRRVASIDGSIGPFAFSRDGRRIAFVGRRTPSRRSYDQPDLCSSIARRTPRNSRPPTTSTSAAPIGGDRGHRAPVAAAPIWSADGNRLFVGSGTGQRGPRAVTRTGRSNGPSPRRILCCTPRTPQLRGRNGDPTPTVLGDLVVVDGVSAPRGNCRLIDALSPS